MCMFFLTPLSWFLILSSFLRLTKDSDLGSVRTNHLQASDQGDEEGEHTTDGMTWTAKSCKNPKPE
jgi:hypothetical protein